MAADDDLLPIYMRPSIFLPLFFFSVWALTVSYRLPRLTPARRPGFAGRIVLNPMVIWLFFVVAGIQPVFLGLFPSIGWLPSSGIWMFAGACAIFDVAPPFVIDLELLYRNKFGKFHEATPMVTHWQTRKLVPFLLSRIEPA